VIKVASLTTERFGTPTTGRDRRALDSARKRSLDQLAGRSVWSLVTLPDGRDDARRLGTCLRWADASGVATRRIDVTAGDLLLELGRRLEGTLRGTAAPGPEPSAADRDAYARGTAIGEALVARSVHAGDVVVLHDPLTAALSAAVRDQGAHVVWELRVAGGRHEPTVEEAWRFLRAYTSAVDAFLVARGGVVRQVAALMPSAGVLSAKLIQGGQESDDLAWSSILADVVHDDRGEHVGGTRHPTPAVAAR
jgi:trehalose synthase